MAALDDDDELSECISTEECYKFARSSTCLTDYQAATREGH